MAPIRRIWEEGDTHLREHVNEFDMIEASISIYKVQRPKQMRTSRLRMHTWRVECSRVNSIPGRILCGIGHYMNHVYIAKEHLINDNDKADLFVQRWDRGTTVGWRCTR